MNTESTTEPRFLSSDQVRTIHRDQLDRFGGRRGVLKLAQLESAVAAPRATFGGEFLHRDLFDMAAAYLRSLTMNHPWRDGNKRAAAVAALVFLKANGYNVTLTNRQLVELVLQVCDGLVDKDGIADVLRRHAVRREERSAPM